MVIKPLGHDSAALWLAPCQPQQYSVDKNRADRIFHFLSLLRLDTFKHPLKIVLNMQTTKLHIIDIILSEPSPDINLEHRLCISSLN